jgi:hypothetical protein
MVKQKGLPKRLENGQGAGVTMVPALCSNSLLKKKPLALGGG